jgi:serine-type D-Ala-D-Ala carboxypeptidase (penicillin-binding protein 5/6)
VRKFALSFLILLIFGIPSYFYISSKSSNKVFSITSPLPDLLTRVLPQAQGEDYAWRPNKAVLGSSIKKPELNANAIAAYDMTENKYLYSHNVHKRLPIASLTKIMTAVVALENMNLNQEISVGQKAATVGEGTMGLSLGEKLTLEEILYGLLLQSGNDAAEAIATASPFGRDNFVFLMNKKAEELGLTNTHFTNPSGLQGDGKQFGTAEDLIILTKYAMQNPKFAEIVATYQYDIEGSDKHKAFTLFNETNLLTSYSGVKGVKTGYTDEAGMCLVTYLDYGGHKIIGVLLNAENRREEMKELLDYSLKSLGVTPPDHI